MAFFQPALYLRSRAERSWKSNGGVGGGRMAIRPCLAVGFHPPYSLMVGFLAFWVRYSIHTNVYEKLDI